MASPPTAIPSCCVSEQFTEFEALAHRYHDYMDYEHGIRCLLELLTMGTAEVGSMGSNTARLNTALRLLPRQHHIVKLDCLLHLKRLDRWCLQLAARCPR